MKNKLVLIILFIVTNVLFGFDFNNDSFSIWMGNVDRIMFTKNEILYVTDENEDSINVIKDRISRPLKIVDSDGFIKVNIGKYDTYITDLKGILVYSTNETVNTFNGNYQNYFNKGVKIKTNDNEVLKNESILNRIDTEQNTGVFISSSGNPWTTEWDSINLPRLHIQCDQSIDRFAILGGNIDFKVLELYKNYARPQIVTIYDGMTNNIIGKEILVDNPHYQVVQFNQQVNDFVIEFNSIYQGKLKNKLYISSIILEKYYTSNSHDYGKSRIDNDLKSIAVLTRT
jgi:hypothetical protein